MHLGGADAVAGALLLHEVGEVDLRSGAEVMAGKMRVFGCTRERTSLGCLEGHHRVGGARAYVDNARPPEAAASEARHHAVAAADVLSRSQRAVGHRDHGPGGEALVVISDHR